MPEVDWRGRIPRERAARWLFTSVVPTRGAHVIEQDVELASAVAGDELEAAQPWLPVDPAAEAWADALLRRQAVDSPCVLINPGAGWGAKRWPLERYAAVAARAYPRGFRILVNAGPGEEPLAEVLVKQTGGAGHAASGSLGHLIALTRRISLAIAGDTGPLHLACALGKPVVGIYGPTDPSRNGPFGTPFQSAAQPGSRRDHTRREAPEAGLLTIQPEEVLRAADELAGRERTHLNDPGAGATPSRTGLHAGRSVARRIRVPLGILAAALYLFELWRRAPQPAAVAWSLALVLPGLWLRGYAAGYVKKNRELTQTGPYAHTRNPLYLGSMLMAAGFCRGLAELAGGSWCWPWDSW